MKKALTGRGDDASSGHVERTIDQIIDPKTGQSIAKSGCLSDPSREDGRLYITLTVPAQDVTLYTPVRDALEAVLSALDDVDQAFVVLTAEGPRQDKTSPPTAKPKRADLPVSKPAQPKTTRARVGAIDFSGIDTIIAVASGKGGVGKSTTTANLAVAFARQGKRVGVLDADVYGPSIPRLFGVQQPPAFADGKKAEPPTSHGVKVMSMGFLIDEGTPMVWRAPMVVSALRQMLTDVKWAPLDILLIDMPPGTGDTQLTLSQQVPLDGAIIVSTPQDLALIDARKGVAMFEKVEVPILGILENMSIYICPNCGHQAPIFGHGGARKDAQRIGVPFLGEIPLDIKIRESSDTGQPVGTLDVTNAHAALYDTLVTAVQDDVSRRRLGQREPPVIVIEDENEPA